jgi:hypothetical protein
LAAVIGVSLTANQVTAVALPWLVLEHLLLRQEQELELL